MKNDNTKKGNVKSIALLFIPYLCVLVATVCVVVYVFLNICYSGYVQLMFSQLPQSNRQVSFSNPSFDKQEEEEIVEIPTTVIENVEDSAEFPSIDFETQWATLNLDGWETRNIPVLLGDRYESLWNGAGLPSFSEFCGRGSRVVIDAHVNTFFRELELTPVGTKVHISTIYGEYLYEVEKIVFFDQYDPSYIYPNHDKEELVLYTCYPYDNGFRLRTERIGLICKYLKGKQWRRN